MFVFDTPSKNVLVSDWLPGLRFPGAQYRTGSHEPSTEDHSTDPHTLPGDSVMII
jgi:hypothetical protein